MGLCCQSGRKTTEISDRVELDKLRQADTKKQSREKHVQHQENIDKIIDFWFSIGDGERSNLQQYDRESHMPLKLT